MAKIYNGSAEVYGMLENDVTEYLPLSIVFKSPSAKVLDFLLLNRDFDYSESDISSLSNTSPRTLQRVLPILKEEKLVKETRKSGKSIMYKANVDSKKGQALLEFLKLSIEDNLDRIGETQVLEKTLTVNQ
ncbi:MAG: hypothetical protein IIA83_00330 [Thaumarchaeota archaeon]|nr:hypothetical protein [Nitrososphaerota archaeon]